MSWIHFSADPPHSLVVFGIRLVGLNAENAKKLLFTVVFIAVLVLLNALLRWLARHVVGNWNRRVVFWVHQVIHILTALVLLIGVVSIWFNEPSRLATAAGMATAGLAFALQRVVTALAGYVVILRGRTFNVGDRITMGGVRGDVIALSFIHTTIMEMGQPPAVQDADPAMWVKSRQYTGRIVTVTNDKVFDTPIYNFTREFPYIWEEMTLPISFKDDRQEAERILLDAARRHGVKPESIAKEDYEEIERRYGVKRADIDPRVYWRITDNWLSMSVRFLVTTHGVRDVKDAMSRDILRGFDAGGIGIASGTYDIVGLPPVRIVRERAKV
jgi:small-conductance mechanosensitive channel